MTLRRLSAGLPIAGLPGSPHIGIGSPNRKAGVTSKAVRRLSFESPA